MIRFALLRLYRSRVNVSVAPRILAPCVVWLVVLTSRPLGASELQIYPRAIELQGAASRQLLVACLTEDGQSVQDVTGQVEWQSQDESVVKIVEGIALPGANGDTTLHARLPDGATAEVPVTVRQLEQPTSWEFRRHVLPILSRAGCNMGACHGTLAGKGGFRLSLRGYFPAGDHEAIVLDARGRRIELSDPESSLLLLKPSAAVPHKGGRRLDPASRDYRVLAEWIQMGAPGPTADDPALVDLEVSPSSSRLAQQAQQQLLVTARYADGRIEDVTRWARFSSADETVAHVDEHGQVTVDGYGEGAIVVWFSSQVVLVRVSSPYPYAVAEERYAAVPPANFIDELVLNKLRQLQLEPSPRCADHEFIRRVYLDTTGQLPEAAAVADFLRDESLDKRRRLVDDLLARESFVDYWTHVWSDLLLVNGRRMRPDAVKAYYQWIRRHVAENTPWDQFARELITAKGDSYEQGATNFYVLHQDPESMSENVCQAFLGLSIGCAKCHNHPLEKWTNDEYYGMANFFARVQAKGWGGEGRSGDGKRTLFVANQGDLVQPLTGKAQPPKPLDGLPLALDSPGDRREYLADWLTSPNNAYFSRAIANRVWANFMGRGIVNPVDDLRASNPARNEELLQALSDYLVAADFDLKVLMRAILNSETYQRSSQSLPSNAAEQYYFSRYYPRRLAAEVLLDAVAQVTTVPSQFSQIGYDGNDFEATQAYPLGTRAIELYDSAVVSGFLDAFGRNARDITCECERSNTPNIVQVLHLNNGSTINDRLRDPQSCVAQAMQLTSDWAQVVREAYLRTLSREPTQSELEPLVIELNGVAVDQQREAVEDLYWSLLSSREFLFNH